jgi:Tfp pilus assembly protein PilN
MGGGAQIVRGANFAYPYSQRDEFYSPRTVKLLIAVSGAVVVLLMILPFYLQHLKAQTQAETQEMSTLVVAARRLAERAQPVTDQMNFLDSLKVDLEDQVALYDRVRSVEYRFDRLLLHLADSVPDGVVLNSIDVRPPAGGQGGRSIRGAAVEDVPEELQNTLVLTLTGSARNAGSLRTLREAMQQSPLFDALNQTETVLDRGISFTITARLPGSGATLAEEGGS